MADRLVTIDQAIKAVSDAAFTLPAEDGGRVLIHTFAGPFGADWDLDGAVKFIMRSTERAWVDHPVGHDLGVLADGRIVYFDVTAPVGGGQPPR